MTEKVNNLDNKTPTTPTSPSSFFGSSFFSNVTSSVSSLSQTIQTKGFPELNKRINEFQAKGIPAELNKKLNVLSQKARELPSQLNIDLESERALFIQQNKKNGDDGAHRSSPIKGSEPVAPWEGYHGYEKEMKRAIMDISTDERNFLISPPEDTSFQFDLNAYSQSAQAALKQDKQLSQMRFLLVPQQVKEPIFWRNYFYRVTIVKQTVLSQPPSSEEPKEEEKADNVLFDFKDDDDESDDNNSVVVIKKKDIITPTIEKKSKEEPSTTKSEEIKKTEDNTNYEGMEEWEIELRKAAII